MKKVRRAILPLCAVAFALSITSLALPTKEAVADGGHAHAVCGRTACEHAEHAEVSFAAFSSASVGELSTATREEPNGQAYYLLPAGRYYLTEHITLDKTLAFQGDTYLCLNGFTLTVKDGAGLEVTAGEVSLSDCGTEGSIHTHSSRCGVLVEGATLNVWGGSVQSTFAQTVRVSEGGTVNQYGGKLVHAPLVSVDGAVSVCGGEYNLYEGSVMGGANGVTADTVGSSVNVYGGTVAYQHGYGIRADAQGTEKKVLVNLAGGSIQETDGESSYARGGLYLCGAVKAELEQVNVQSTACGIYGDSNAEILILPREDRQVRVDAGDTAIMIEGGPAQGEGRLLVQGGNFRSKGNVLRFKSGEAVITGGVFDNSSATGAYATCLSDAGVPVRLQGGTFTANATYQRAVEGAFRMDGAPVVNGMVIVSQVQSDGEYLADFSGYSGEKRLSVWYTAMSPALSHEFIVGKGTANAVVLVNSGWEAISGRDEEGRAVVKVVHVAHEGGNPTCTQSAQCTVCQREYTLPHAYGEWVHDEEGHWRVCENCQGGTQKAAHHFADGACVCGEVPPALPVGAVVGLCVGGVVIVGLGAFSVVWFVVKKRTFRDLFKGVQK